MDYSLTRQEIREHFGAETGARYRVWVARSVRNMAYYYVHDVTEAVAVIDKYGDGALAAGFEVNDERDGWETWYDDRGCDIDDLLQERDDDPDNWAAE